MFEQVEEIRLGVDAVFELAAPLDRGDTLTHESIREVLGLEPHEGRWDRIVHRALGRLLRERGIACLAEITVGYRLLTQGEQLNESERRMRRANRQLRRGRASVTLLPVKGLTVHQRRIRTSRIDLLKASEHQLNQSLRDHAEHLRATPVMPRRQVQVGGDH
jgi:hypothetical protein